MLKVKPSRYNLVVDTKSDGSILLFNTFSTALCLLSKESKSFLEVAHYNMDELPVENRKTIEQFLSMGFLVHHDVDEFSHLELRKNLVRYGNRKLTLTIGPTLNCNMCCPYCFETKGHQAMTSETAEKLIKFIENYIEAKKIEAVDITWYGGEPLLEMRRIEQISNELISYCQKRSIHYSAKIVTNGFCLNPNNAEILKSLNVSYAQITIDGLEETHNARRKLKSGGDSFWPIVKNIEATKAILPIVVRVNVDKTNAHEIDKLTDFFINDMNWGKNPTFYLAPVEKCTDACGADIDQCLSSEDFSILCQKIMSKMFERGITEIAHRNYPAYSEVGCAATCVNNFVIDANGSFYTCWNYFGETSKSIGSLDEPDKIGLSGDYFNWLTIPTPEKCKECVYLPICQSGCPDYRIKNQNEPVCGFRTHMYIENIKLSFHNYVAQK